MEYGVHQVRGDVQYEQYLNLIERSFNCVARKTPDPTPDYVSRETSGTSERPFISMQPYTVYSGIQYATVSSIQPYAMVSSMQWYTVCNGMQRYATVCNRIQ